VTGGEKQNLKFKGLGGIFMSLKKKLIPLVAVTGMLFSIGNPVHASEIKNYNINSLEEFLSAAKEISSSNLLSIDQSRQSNSLESLLVLNDSESVNPEEINLLENTDPEVIEDYFELVGKEVNSFTIPEGSSPLGNSEETYILPISGAQIVVTTTNEFTPDPIKEQKNGTFSTLSVQKLFGTHKYTIDYRIIAIGAIPPQSTLVTTYTNKSDGLRATGATVAGSFAILPYTQISSATITDSRAELLGYDINAKGDYKITFVGYNGVGIWSADMEIVSRILWSAQGSTSSYVEQSYSVTGDPTR